MCISKEYYTTSVVLSDEVINNLNIISDGNYVDCTFGQGGHSRIILSYLNKYGRLLAIDRDYSAVQIGKTLETQDKRFTVIYGKFSRLFKYIRNHNLIGEINGILFDLGLSKMQLEDSERGFSFIRNGPLDMRMDTNYGMSAASWLRKASFEKIVWVLKTFGEERFSRRIAHSIVVYRAKNPLIYTHELVKLIIRSIPFRDRYKHPATRTFQAIRIYINNELEEIEKALKAALYILAPGGRLLVISFHSLEDRIIKYFIREHSLPLSISHLLFKNIVNIHHRKHYDDTKNFFMSCNQNKVYLKFINKIFPSKREIRDNICSRSAVLRCAEKLIV